MSRDEIGTSLAMMLMLVRVKPAPLSTFGSYGFGLAESGTPRYLMNALKLHGAGYPGSRSRPSSRTACAYTWRRSGEYPGGALRSMSPGGVFLYFRMTATYVKSCTQDSGRGSSDVPFPRRNDAPASGSTSP